MDIDELIKDKTVKSKEKIEVLSNWLLEGIISARTLIGYAEKANDPVLKSNAYHNLGNAYFNQQKYKESIEAYKNSLRLQPKDMQTKQNLAQAQMMLRQQEQQQEQQNDKISKEDANRILQALQQDEKQLQEKLKKQMVRTKRVGVLKDW